MAAQSPHVTSSQLCPPVALVYCYVTKIPEVESCNNTIYFVHKAAIWVVLSRTACPYSTWHHLQRLKGWGVGSSEGSFAGGCDSSRWRVAGTSAGAGTPNMWPPHVSWASLEHGGRVPRMSVLRERARCELGHLWCPSLGGHARPPAVVCSLRRSQKAAPNGRGLRGPLLLRVSSAKELANMF